MVRTIIKIDQETLELWSKTVGVFLNTVYSQYLHVILFLLHVCADSINSIDALKRYHAVLNW